ncbi:hypothetical protein J8631_25055 [Serratia fonticola]|uniref:hypothetical protein n=1 Tax=Serratia fonticola TaxID=47917 RepID=UPI001AE418DF|nr:hypothetical protein [Serratia fonticola]MBP1038848.1 hypothetical protein [Serratia fonticola]
MKIIPLYLFLFSAFSSATSFSDVQPKDAEYQQLYSLSERYGCVSGSPGIVDQFKFNRALSRYEFAAVLKACIDRIEELMATATDNMISTSDIETLNKLKAEFENELNP